MEVRMVEFIVILIILVAVIIFGIWKKIEKEEKEKKKKVILAQANRNLQIIENSKDIINKSKNFNTILSRFNVIFENIERLKKLEEEYPDVTEPKPSEIKKFYLNEKEKFIKEFLLEEVEGSMKKARDTIGIKTKINIANKAIIKIIEGRKELKEEENMEELDEKEREIKVFVHKIQLDDFLEKAKKAEFMGQKIKALNFYKEALYFLQTEEIDDSLKKKMTDEIEAKISELSQ